MTNAIPKKTTIMKAIFMLRYMYKTKRSFKLLFMHVYICELAGYKYCISYCTQVRAITDIVDCGETGLPEQRSRATRLSQGLWCRLLPGLCRAITDSSSLSSISITRAEGLFTLDPVQMRIEFAFTRCASNANWIHIDCVHSTKILKPNCNWIAVDVPHPLQPK